MLPAGASWCRVGAGPVGAVGRVRRRVEAGGDVNREAFADAQRGITEEVRQLTEWNAEAIGVGIRDGRAWLTTEEAAEHLAVSKRTLARLRRSGDGPKFARRGQIIRYRAADLDEWMGTRDGNVAE